MQTTEYNVKKITLWVAGICMVLAYFGRSFISKDVYPYVFSLLTAVAFIAVFFKVRQDKIDGTLNKEEFKKKIFATLIILCAFILIILYANYATKMQINHLRETR